VELVWLSCSRPWCQSPPAASNYAQESLDRYFRIEYQVEPSVARPVVSGYVDNMHPGLPADRMQLAIEALDASGKVVGTSSPGYLAVYQPAIAATSARWSFSDLLEGPLHGGTRSRRVIRAGAVPRRPVCGRLMKLRGLAARPEMLRGSAASFSPDAYCSPDHLSPFASIPGRVE